MDEKLQLEVQLQQLLATEPAEELFSYMEQKVSDFFSTPDIPKFYRILKPVDFSTCQRSIPKLMIAWMAFLSGDNAYLFPMLENLHEDEFRAPYESSLFYTLKAMVDYMTNTKEGLRYAKIALEILPDQDQTFFAGNVKLTYGQLLASSDQYRAAAGLFSEAAGIFNSQKLYFLGAVALVNEAVNLIKLGEFQRVIDKCNKALMMAGNFQGGVPSYWQMAHLPLGMCYFELDKPNLAAQHLKLAMDSIDQSGLFHMHGLIELYLFKCYYMLQDFQALKLMKNEVGAKFEHMRFGGIDLIISMMKIYALAPGESENIQPDIEKFEMEYLKSGNSSNSLVVDTLVFLKLKGLSDAITVTNLEERLARLRYIGHIPNLQLTQLELAELYYLEKGEKEAVNYLKEVVGIYKEYGGSACFYALPLRTMGLLSKFEPQLFKVLDKRLQSTQITPGTPADAILSSREREIMQLISHGKSNEEISKTLYIGIGTIKWHINHIFSKLEVKNRIQAVEKARSLGVI